jgi:hypothetical protein
VPGSAGAVREASVPIGRQFGEKFGEIESFLSGLHSGDRYMTAKAPVWDRMTEADKAGIIAQADSMLTSLPKLPGYSDPTLASAAIGGFEEGVEEGYEQARVRALADVLQLEIFIAAAGGAAEATEGLLTRAAARVTESLPVVGVGAGGAGFVKVPTIPRAANAGLMDLAQFRRALLLKPGEGTLARLDVGGQSFYGINAHGQDFVKPPGVTFQSLRHAEGDAFSQANLSGIRGGEGILYVDRKPCGWCMSSLKGYARDLGLNRLTVVSPEGSIGFGAGEAEALTE